MTPPNKEENYLRTKLEEIIKNWAQVDELTEEHKTYVALLLMGVFVGRDGYLTGIQSMNAGDGSGRLQQFRAEIEELEQEFFRSAQEMADSMPDVINMNETADAES